MNKLEKNGRQHPSSREAGQGIVEYLIIIALVGLAVVVIVNLMQPAIGDVFSRFVDRANVAPPALVGFSRATATPTPVAGATLTITVLPDDTAGSVNVSPSSPVSGDTVTLTAVPAPGWRFAGWGDDLSGTQSVQTFYFGSDTVVSAIFVEQRYTLNIIPFGLGNILKTPDQPDYAYNQEVLLQAVPEAGSEFFTWGGDAPSNNNNPITITMDRNKSVEAFFQIGCYTLTVLEDPDAGGNTTLTPAPNCNGGTQYEHGTTVNLLANPAAGYGFASWSHSGYPDDPTNPALLTLNSNATVTANFFEIEYILTTAVNGRGSIEVSAPPPYYWQNTVNLTAVPDTGAYFTGWSGAVTGTTNPASLTFDGDKSVTANFQNYCYTLNSAINPSGTGTVTYSPTSSPGCNANQYIYGQNVALTANPVNGYQFTSWGGSASGTNPVTSITIQGNTSVSATFQPRCYSFTLTAAPSGSGAVSASPTSNCANGGYLFDTAVTLTASPASGYVFANWSGSVSGGASPTTFNISSPTNVTANFVAANAVFVVPNATSLSTSETALRNRLQGLGYTVAILDDNNANGYNPSGMAFILVSPAVSDATYGSAFRDTAVPVILMRRSLADELRLADSSGSATNRRQIDMIAASSSHPLAAGKSGRIAIYGSNAAIGNIRDLGSGAVRIANAYGSTSAFTIVGYPTGAAMTSGLSAPDARVGFFLERADLYNTDAWDLFDAAVQWAIGN